nr:hypothetical protein BaRGS_031801 [Batillaria attramentaria]
MDDTFFDDDCFFEDDFDENYSEEDMLSAKSFPENCSSPFATSLSEVLEEALYVASRQPSDPEDFGLADFDALAQASGKPRRKRSSKKKDRKYVYQTEQTFQTDAGVDVTAYTEDTQSDTSSELDSSTDSLVLLDKLTSMRMKSVRVVLPEESVSGSALSHQYGNTYTEAGCLPRKFLIDITDRARESLKHVQSFRDVYLPSVDLSSCVVFSYDCEDVESGAVTASVERHYVYSVTLNMNYQDHDFVINTLDKMARYDSVEVVLERVLEFICTLPHDKLVRKDVECPPCALENKIQPDFRMVTEVNGWNPSFLSLSSVSCLPAASRPTTRQSAHVNGFDGAPDANKADREALGAEGDAGVLLCQSLTPEPGYCSICFDDISPGCSGAAPTATALSGCGHWFCNTCWLSHLSLTARGGVSGATRRTLECPEYGCRVEVDVGTLLSLLHVRDVQLLVRRRLDLQMTGSRRAKWCPNPLCGRLIQLNTERSNKQTEPTSLACTCGTRLCFKCLGTAHWPASCAEAKEYSDSFGIQRRVIKHVDTSPREGSQWYELAIQHRRMQYKQEVKMNIKMADQLAGRLLAFTWKRSEAGMPFSVSSAANLNETVAGILKLKLELHHVIEHTAAALDVSSKDVATVAPKSARTKDASNKVISMTFIKAKDVVGRLEFLCSSLDLLLKHLPKLTKFQ